MKNAIQRNIIFRFCTSYHLSSKKNGLSRLELARMAGVGKTVVYDVEHAKKTVRLDTLVKILNVLNITIELKGPLMQTYEADKDR